jgi:hypothetical protein
MTKRLWVVLLMAVFCIITLARAQDATPTSVLAGRHYEIGRPLQRFSLPANGFGISVTKAAPGPWTTHLVGRLAKCPELSRRQLKIILDAISLSESFAASDSAPAIKIEADNALQGLRQRALAAFPKREVARLFDSGRSDEAEQELLRKYYEFSAISVKGRRALFRSESADQKSALWRTHLALSLLKHPEFDGIQKEIILTGMLLATPQFFDVPSSSPDWKVKVQEPSRALERQIAVLFTREDAAAIFATLGDNIEAAKHGPTNAGSSLLKSIDYEPLSDAKSYPQWTPTRYTQDFEFEQNSSCQCSTSSDYCPIWGYCRPSACSTQSGCGTFWSYPCNGVCR